MLKKTALFEEHTKLNGKLVDFAGWNLPIQYTSVIDEHVTCRTKAGIFDVSHMGEFIVKGKYAKVFLNYLLTNDLSLISNGKAQYTLLCNRDGGIIDDLIVYQLLEDQFLIVVNASNIENDFAQFQKIYSENKTRWPEVEILNKSDQYTQIALQGPLAKEILQPLVNINLDEINPFCFVEKSALDIKNVIIARTGYTGSDGFELYLPWEGGPAVWQSILKSGTSSGLKPCGLASRDTLRIEMKYPLYGQEITLNTTPLEAGLVWTVKFNKEDFVGKDALIQQKSVGITKKLVGLELLQRGVPRTGYFIYSDSEEQNKIGYVTSGTHSPSLNTPIAIAYLDGEFTKLDSEVYIKVRNKLLPARVTKTPFYKKTKEQ